jgi:hypothetical protein
MPSKASVLSLPGPSQRHSRNHYDELRTGAYSVDYGIYTLLVEGQQSEGKFKILQTFQQKGVYSTYYVIPLGGRGHHPVHAVIEDAVKWLSAGGLTDPNQNSNLLTGGVKP